MEKEKEVIPIPTRARALIHVWDAPFSPVEVHIHFCSASFEEVARVLMGDAHPKKVSFIVFHQIQPEIQGVAGLVVECQTLEPMFEFGHELIHL